MTLAGQPNLPAAYSDALRAGAHRDGYGTCLISGNTISGNSASSSPALYLKDRKKGSDSSRLNSDVGYVVVGNTFSQNRVVSSSTAGAVVSIIQDGFFENNVVTGNDGGPGQVAAVMITSNQAAGPAILRAHNNTFSNPDCGFELRATTYYTEDEYVDARFSYFGSTSPTAIKRRIADTVASPSRGKIIWRQFRGSTGGPVADPWSDNAVWGVVDTDTVLDGTQSPVHIIGPLTVTSNAVLTVVPGSTVLVDGGVAIKVLGSSRLVAAGTAALPITFGPSSTGSAWQGILFSTSAAATATVAEPHAVDSSDGSLLEWCVVAGAGRDATSPNQETAAAIRVASGGPAIISTTIKDSVAHGLVVENNSPSSLARCILVDSFIQDCMLDAVLFQGNHGLGPVPHIIARNVLRRNGRSGVRIGADVFQGTSGSNAFGRIRLVVAGNAIEGNRGGIRVAAGKGLYRNVDILDNVIKNNRGASDDGSGVVITLNGAPSTDTAFNAGLRAAAVRVAEGFGTCHIRGNTISANTAQRYPALLLNIDTNSHGGSYNNEAVGFVVEDNIMTKNVAMSTSSTSAAARIVHDGWFERNTITGNNAGGHANAAAVVVYPSGGILHAHNNTYQNPACGLELRSAGTGGSVQQYVDARFSYWGSSQAAKVKKRVLGPGVIIWRLFRGAPAPNGPVADPFTNIVFGPIDQDTQLSGVVLVIGPLAVTAVLTVAPGSTILVEPGLYITLTGQARLVAQGTESAPIVFDASDRGTPWGGLVFRTSTAATAVTTEPFAVDHSAGSVLEWCTVDNAGAGGLSDAAVRVERGGAPAIVFSTIQNSAGSGVVIENTQTTQQTSAARCIVVDCSISDNQNAGVLFTGAGGLGKVPHVIARSEISGNGQVGVYFAGDVYQGWNHNYADLGVFVIGNQVRDNGHASSAGERGGIRVQLGGAGLYRPVTLQDNEIRGNRGAGDGSAVVIVLAGAPAPHASAHASVQTAAVENGYGTGLVSGNTIASNTGDTYTALHLTDTKCSTQSACKHPAVGFVVTGNHISANSVTDASGSIIGMKADGIFRGNIVVANTHAGGATSPHTFRVLSSRSVVYRRLPPPPPAAKCVTVFSRAVWA